MSLSPKETRIRVRNASNAMKAIGINETKVKPVLKSLLKLYKQNWGLIEEQNYRVLADAIFENDKAEAKELSKKNVGSEERTPRTLKRLRCKYEDGQGSTTAAHNTRAHKEEPCEIQESCGPPLNASKTVVEPVAEKNEGKETSLDLSSLTDNAHLAISAVVKALAAAEERAKKAEEKARASMAALKKMEKEKLAVEEQLKNVKEKLNSS